MKLLSCYVSSFGKLKDYSYTFNDKLNTIKQDNGWGKSTFATFIKSMFYGLDDARRALEDNERKRFAPWNSTEKFGGNLTFEWKGQRFTIERFFGTKAAEDTVKLYDSSTNKEYSEGAAVKDIGKRVFSIDEEGFLSTTYFSQKDFEIKSNASITAKYNEVCEIQDSASFDKAMEKLGDKIKELKARGDKGRIAEIKRNISALSDGIERTKQSLLTTESLKKDLEIVKKESDTLSANIKDLTSKLEIAGKKEAVKERKRRYDALNLELQAIKTEKAKADAVLSGKNVSDDKISSSENCLRDLYDLSAKAETLRADVAEYAPKTTIEVNGNSRIYKMVAVISAILMAAGAIIVATLALWGLVFSVIGFISGVFSITKYLKIKTETLNEKRAESQLAEIYGKKKRELAEVEEAKSLLIKGLDGFFSEFNFTDADTSYERKISAIKEAAVKSRELEFAAEKAERELKDLAALGVETKTEVGESVSELNEQLNSATEWYRQKVSAAERLKTRIDALELSADSLCDAENKISELKERLAESEKELKILTLTADFMARADETLKTRYRAPLQESLNKYLKFIAGRELDVSVDTDMKVSVKVSGAERSTEFFSKGYRNLFEICKRFALTDILFTVEKPFIILDDPFCNLDDEKTEEALSLIKKLSEEYQIIYFICHESRRA